MTAKELLEDERYGYDHFTKLTNTGISPDEDNISEFAEYYHKRKLKLLAIQGVSKRLSEMEEAGKEATSLIAHLKDQHGFNDEEQVSQDKIMNVFKYEERW